MNLKIITSSFLISVLVSGCSAVKSLSTDTVYTYSNGFITDRDHNIAFHYDNGFITKQLNVSKDKYIKINDHLELSRLSPNCFLYTAWANMGSWGRVGSNGVVVTNNGKAILIDSPTIESQTVELAWWFDKNLDVKFETFVPGHWHSDCVGGMSWLNRNGVKTIANKKTNQILTSKGLEKAKEEFADSLTINVDGLTVKLYYIGGGHSTDNIVAWIPAQKILFAGCMIKGINSTSIGNIEDSAPLDQWLQTIDVIAQKFSDAKIIVPGHGNVGGKELFEHTKEIVSRELSKNKHLL